MNIKERVETTLQPTGYAVVPQGSYSPSDILPEPLVTYNILPSVDTQHYDNMPSTTAQYIQVNFYSTDPALIISEPTKISKMMLAAGFRRDGKGGDIGLDKETGKYGWGMDYIFIERE